jgi:hypothetical membrane protein
MSTTRRVAGGVAWMLTVLYFAVQPVVVAAWRGDYDILRNTISDLGVTECGVFAHLGGEQISVCSPRHDLMNATFVAVGLLIGLGTLLTRRVWPRSRTMTVATWALMVTSIGAVLIGLAPANQNLALHAVGAFLQIPGSIAPLLAGIGLRKTHRGLVLFSGAIGAVGTIATLLFFAGVYLGLGPGGMERLAFDPLIIWLIVVGTLAATNRLPVAR